MNLPEAKQKILNQILIDLKSITNIKSIVLGGSYATGTATDSSDVDVALYYSENDQFDINEIKKIAKKYCIDETPVVTGFYEWGPWVNGGAWIQTPAGKVDFLYRNIEHVERTIEKAQRGEYENHYEQQPPYGFNSVIYLAETKACIPLHDPTGVIDKLKEQVKQYPQKLKDNIIQYSIWSAEFTTWHADRFAKKADMYNTVGCLSRALKNVVDALFAINEIYPISDKRAIEILENSCIRPGSLKERIDSILSVEKHTSMDNVSLLRELLNEIKLLAKGKYKPFYKLID